MTDGYSLSDIGAVSGGGFGGGSSWVLIILFALIFGWGGNGIGGNNGTLTESTMCSMNNFTQLENAVGRMSDSMSNQNMLIANGMSQLGYQNLEQSNQIARDMCTGFANGVAATNAAAAQNQSCCCEINRNIDAVRYENAINTAAINANLDAKFAAIEKNQLEQTIANQAQQISQLFLAQQMAGVVRYPSVSTWSVSGNPFCGNGYC